MIKHCKIKKDSNVKIQQMKVVEESIQRMKSESESSFDTGIQMVLALI